MIRVQPNAPTSYQPASPASKNAIDMTFEERKAMYDKMYDENGNMRVKPSEFEVTETPKYNLTPHVKGYGVTKVGDDYAVFAIFSGNSGQGALTADQLSYLVEKYGTGALSSDDRAMLLADLSCLGVIHGSMAYMLAFPDKYTNINGERVKNLDALGLDAGYDQCKDLRSLMAYCQRLAARAQASMVDITTAHLNEIMFCESERKKYDCFTAIYEVLEAMLELGEQPNADGVL